MPKTKKPVKVAKSQEVKDVKPTVAPVPNQDETQFKVETVVAKKKPLKKSEIFENGWPKETPSPAEIEKNRMKYRKAVSRQGAF
tara:strand:+ start:4438 stop:4689 length:252 start_codon:yes stop_codon:yes gene_type:complete